MRYFDIVYSIVRKVLEGRVVTYGSVAKKAGVTPRMVGRAMHNNPDPKRIPCHRVVNRDGRIAQNYTFGGAGEQKRKLLAEGVRFRDEQHVDLSKCLWQAKFEARNPKFETISKF